MYEMESVHVSLGAQQLCQEHRAARSAPQGVVGEAHELVVVLGVRPQAAHGHGHAVLQVPVQPGLGPVRLLKVVGSFLAAVMVQVYGRSFTPEFKIKLFNVTKEIVDQVPSLKNNEALPVIISSNGKVTTKENCKSQETEKIYEPIMNFILAEYNKNKDK